MKINIIKTKDYITKSNLPFFDYVINPYVGCTHACKYCYASFMKRFTGHTEEWGKFIDVKLCDEPLNKKKLTGKSIFLSSVTDPYNPLEKEYKITRNILEQLVDINCRIYISTKSSFIIRDINLLKKCNNVIVDISLNTLDEKFRKDMDNAASVQHRLDTLKILHDNEIYTALFISPWFPELTDFKVLIETTKEYVNEYWFENLNLRGDYKKRILNYIAKCHPKFIGLYDDIYRHNNIEYWEQKEKEFKEYCKINKIRFTNAFNHSKLVADKKVKNDKLFGIAGKG